MKVSFILFARDFRLVCTQAKRARLRITSVEKRRSCKGPSYVHLWTETVRRADLVMGSWLSLSWL